MSTADIRHNIETHVSCIDGTYYTFGLDSVTLVPGTPRLAVLHIAVSRLNSSGPPRPTANMRVTAAYGELHRVRFLLSKALQDWLLASAPAEPVIH